MMLSFNISAVCKGILPTFVQAIGSTFCCGGIATETFSVGQVYMVMGISVKHWQIKASTWRFTPLVRSINILAILCVMVLLFNLRFIFVLSIFWLFVSFLCSCAPLLPDLPTTPVLHQQHQSVPVPLVFSKLISSFLALLFPPPIPVCSVLFESSVVFDCPYHRSWIRLHPLTFLPTLSCIWVQVLCAQHIIQCATVGEIFLHSASKKPMSEELQRLPHIFYQFQINAGTKKKEDINKVLSACGLHNAISTVKH